MRLKYIFILLTLISCKSSHRRLYNRINLEMKTTFEIINNESFDCEVIEAIFEIDIEELKIDNSFIFNIYELSYECNSYENSHLGIFKDMKLLNSLHKSHFLIENNLKEFKIFDESIYKKNIDFDDDCTYRFFNNIEITKSSKQKEIKASKILCKRDLLLRKGDNKIRFWYLFKPDSIQKKHGYKTSLIKSNWIRINDNN